MKLLLILLILLGISCQSTRISGNVDRGTLRQVSSIEALWDENYLPSQGTSVPIGVNVFSEKKASYFYTQGLLNGQVSWNVFNVLVIPGTFKQGWVIPGNDFTLIDKDTIMVILQLKERLNVMDTLMIPVYSDVVMMSHHNGEDGRHGGHGQDGKPSRNGESGEDGKRGGDGHEVEAFVDVLDDGHRLYCKVRVEDHTDGRISRFLIDPNGGELWVYANGGDGGRGGNGGYGGPGQDETEDEPALKGGKGGIGGDGGKGGEPGTLVIHFDENALEYSDRIRFFNVPGTGGEAGKGGKHGKDGLTLKQQKEKKPLKKVVALILKGKKSTKGPDGIEGIPGLAGFPVQVVSDSVYIDF